MKPMADEEDDGDLPLLRRHYGIAQLRHLPWSSACVGGGVSDARV